MTVEAPQAGRVDQEGAYRRWDPPQGNMQRLSLNAPRLQHKVMHKDNRPEGNEYIFPEEQANVIGRRRHRA